MQPDDRKTMVFQCGLLLCLYVTYIHGFSASEPLTKVGLLRELIRLQEG